MNTEQTQMNTTSETPRTDAEVLRLGQQIKPEGYGPATHVHAGFARELERELREYRVKCHEAIRQAAMQSGELDELKAWRAGQKGIEDYYIVKENLYVAETAADMWRKCAVRMSEAWDSNSFEEFQFGLAECEKLKGAPITPALSPRPTKGHGEEAPLQSVPGRVESAPP